MVPAVALPVKAPALIPAALPAVIGLLLRGRHAARIRRRRAVVDTELPFAVDVIAACLRAGLPVDAALTAAAGAVDGDLGDRLGAAATAVRSGTSIGEVLPPADAVADLTAVQRALRRSGESGAGLADGLAALADDLREERHAAASARVHRLGVWMALPLTLCFLPAFVAAGLVPVVVSAMSQVLHQI